MTGWYHPKHQHLNQDTATLERYLGRIGGCVVRHGGRRDTVAGLSESSPNHGGILIHSLKLTQQLKRWLENEISFWEGLLVCSMIIFGRVYLGSTPPTQNACPHQDFFPFLGSEMRNLFKPLFAMAAGWGLHPLKFNSSPRQNDASKTTLRFGMVTCFGGCVKLSRVNWGIIIRNNDIIMGLLIWLPWNHQGEPSSWCIQKYRWLICFYRGLYWHCSSISAVYVDGGTS